VFLDVDCLPSTRLVARYAEVAGTDEYRHSLLCGQVSYLPPGFSEHQSARALERYGVPHHARPILSEGDVLDTDDYELFWSLSFAINAPAWRDVGGFCEVYTGYGGEDTDFGQCAKAAGLPMRWVGGATAYHQHHPVSDPPVEHFEAVLNNAQTFAGRWGWWPMHGWLQAFERQGLITYDAEFDRWCQT